MSDWQAERLGSIVTVNYGDALPDRLRVTGGKVPVYGSNGVVGQHDRAVAKAPAIIIGRKGSIGALHYTAEPSWPIDTAYFIDEAPERLLLKWLYLALSTLPLSHLKQEGPKAGIRRADLYELQIPIPPVPEQQRLVTRIDALTRRSQDLHNLNASLVEDASRLLAADYSRISKDAPTRRFGDIAKLVRRRVEIKPDGSYRELGIRSFGKGTFHKPALTGRQLGNKRVFRVHPGDLVFMNVFAWEGAIAVARNEDRNRVGSHRFMTHEIDTERATPEFLCHHFLTDVGLEQIRAASPGSAGRNRTLGINKLHGIPVPVPPIDKQRRFVTLCAIRDKLKRLQAEAEAELAAFIPALLRRRLSAASCKRLACEGSRDRL